MTEIEKGAFLQLFNRNGYVLDFSTPGFDTFTMASVGVALCSKYQASKGKSLLAFVQDADEEDTLKLFADLLDHYETYCIDNHGEEKYSKLYEKCKNVIQRELSDVQIETPAIKCVNREYIRDIALRASRDIDNGELDSAITKARTLLEEVFCLAIEDRKEVPCDKGDIKKLYTQVKGLYNMHANKEMDKRINELLSGLEKIIDSIAEMRNKNSDAHGVGAKRIKIEDYHARLFVNSSMTLADFVLSVKTRKSKMCE